MMRRRIPCAVAMLAAGILGAGCGGSSYSSDDGKLVPVSGVTLTKTTTFLLLGTEEQLVENVLPANATEKRVLWESGNDTIVSVSGAGRIKGVGLGTATITVRTADGGKVAHCEVTVSRDLIPLTGITLDPPKIDVTGGTATTLKATLTPANAKTSGLTWDIQPSGIAKIVISADGYGATITGVKVGDATVTVTSQDNKLIFATAAVRVSPVPVTGVALSQTKLNLQAARAGMTDGDAASLTATVAPSNATNREVTWTTSDALVATLSSTAGETVTVVAHNKGTATITVTADGGTTATCAVTVEAPAPGKVAVESVSASAAAVGLEATPATTTIVRAFIQPPTATNQGIYWTTTDKTVAAISPVSGGPSADSVSGSEVLVTAGKLGMAQLTATTQDGGKKATVDVGVYLVDADIPGNLAATSLHLSKGQTTVWDTRLGDGSPQEVLVGKLLYYADDKGFMNGGTGPTGGITINFFAAGTTAATFGVPVPKTEGYVGIPAQSMTFPPGSSAASVKVSVTASAASGTPTVALLDHATKRPYGIRQMTEGPPYVFDGVPAGAQVDIIDGAANGASLTISHVRVEPSGTGAMNLTPPPDVTPGQTVVAATSLTLNWTNPTISSFDHVEISYGSPATTVSVPKTDTSKAFTGLTTGTSYTFLLKAVDTRGNKSAGISVTATPASVAPLLDEMLTDKLCNEYLTTTSGTPQTVAVSKLIYLAPALSGKQPGQGYFKASGADKLMFQQIGFAPANTGSTATGVSQYVAVPASGSAYTATTATSVKITVVATQYQALSNMHLALLDGSNKILVQQIVDAGPGNASGTARPYVFDGVKPNVEIRITADQNYLMLSEVKVEPSTTPIQYQ